MTYTTKMRNSLQRSGFTRRQYEFVADVLKDLQKHIGAKEPLKISFLGYQFLCRHFGKRMAGVDVRFNMERFLKACDAL